jgi:hypothetical protein
MARGDRRLLSSGSADRRAGPLSLQSPGGGHGDRLASCRSQCPDALDIRGWLLHQRAPLPLSDHPEPRSTGTQSHSVTGPRIPKVPGATALAAPAAGGASRRLPGLGASLPNEESLRSTETYASGRLAGRVAPPTTRPRQYEPVPPTSAGVCQPWRRERVRVRRQRGRMPSSTNVSSPRFCSSVAPRAMHIPPTSCISSL